MTKIRFFLALQNIKVSEDLGKGIVFESLFKDRVVIPNIYLTNNREVISNLLSREVAFTMGALKYYSILESNIVCYADGEFDETNVDPVEYLNNFLSAIKILSFCFWLVRDNAIDFEIGFLLYEVNNQPIITSNTYGGLCKLSNGEKDTVSFDSNEMEFVRNIFAKTEIDDIRKTEKVTGIIPDNNRIEISSYLLQSARRETDLGIKIANYSICFEAMLTNDNTEMSHKLSERIAYLLSGDSQERVEIYKKVKKVYAVRSTILHGSRLKTNLVQELSELSMFCDSTLRTLLLYGYTKGDYNVFHFKNELFEDYFLKLTMGVSVESIK